MAENLKLAPGLFFDTGSNMMGGFCGHPKLCISVTGKRVYFHRHFEDQERNTEEQAGDTSYCSLSSVNYVRESFAELNAIYKLSTQCVIEIHKATDAVTAKFKNKVSTLTPSPVGLEPINISETPIMFLFPYGLKIETLANSGSIRASKLKEELCEPAADAIESFLLALACEGLLTDEVRFSNALVTAVEAVAGHNE